MFRKAIISLYLCLTCISAWTEQNSEFVIMPNALTGEKAYFGDRKHVCLVIAEEENKSQKIGLNLPLGRVRINAYFRYNNAGKAYLENSFGMIINGKLAKSTVLDLAQGYPLSLELINREPKAQCNFLCLEITDKSKIEKKKMMSAFLLKEAKEKPNDDGLDMADDDLDLDLKVDDETLFDAAKRKVPMLLLEKIMVTRLSGPVVIRELTSDRITYKPGAKGKLVCTMENLSSRTVDAELSLVIETGLDRKRRLGDLTLRLKPKETVSKEIPFETGHEIWGRGFYVILKTSQGADNVTHAVSVMTSPWQVLIMGAGWPQSDSGYYTKDQAIDEAQELAEKNLRNYANAYEAFAWEPSAFCDMTPDDNKPYYAGQLQYCYKRENLKILHDTYHKFGISCISYFFPAAGGYRGLLHAMQYPEQMSAPVAGFGHSAFSADILDRMRENRYRRNSQEDFWSLWISSGTNSGYEAVDWACNEIVESAKMIGWDGLRFDGRFRVWGDPVKSAQLYRYIEDKIRKRNPGFAFAYNVGGKRHNVREGAFSDLELGAVASRGNYAMTEYYRGLKGNVKINIAHLQNFGDMVRLHGGYMLAMADGGGDWNFALMYAAGSRIWLGGFDPAIVKFNKFVTRFSEFILDPAMERLENPSRILQPVSTCPFLWDSFIYEKPVDKDHSKLVMQLVNVSDTFVVGGSGVASKNVNPVQKNVQFKLNLPAGYRAEKVFASDDYWNFSPMKAELHDDILMVPQVKVWTLVVIDLKKSDAKQDLAAVCAVPLDFRHYNPLSTTEQDNIDLMIGPEGDPDPDKVNRAVKFGKVKVTPALLRKLITGKAPEGFEPKKRGEEYANFAEHREAMDVKWYKGEPAPFKFSRNGVPDIHYARGCFYHLNRLYEALAKLDKYRLTVSGIEKKFYGRGDRGPFCDINPGTKNFLPGYPATREDLGKYDILILDNIPMASLRLEDRRAIKDFVEAGGDLLVLGGWYALSKGAYEGSFVEDVLPVLCKQESYLFHLPEYSRTIAATSEFEKVLGVKPPEFSKKPSLVWVNHVKPREGADVLMKAGVYPLLIAGEYGKGRVLVWAASHSGRPEDPYWQQPVWPDLVHAMLKWLEHRSFEKTPPDPAVAGEAKEIMDKLSMDAFDEGTVASASTEKEVLTKLKWLLDRQEETYALFVARYLLANSGKLPVNSYSVLTEKIVPFVRRSPEWGNVVKPYLDKTPEGLARLVAEIASVNADDLTFTQIMAWDGLDDVTRLRCVANSTDPKAVGYLEKLNQKLDETEAEWAEKDRRLGRTSDIYWTRLLRPFVNYALIRCGKRNAQTLYQMARGCVELPYYTWRQHWIQDGLVGKRWSRETVLKGPSAVKAAEAEVKEGNVKLQALINAERQSGYLFTAANFAVDEDGLRAVEKAIREADCHKSIPRCLKLLRSLKPEQLRSLKALRDAKLSEIRNSYRTWVGE